MPYRARRSSSLAMGCRCPFRFVYRGRTFCAVAIRERKFTTIHVEQGTCAECPVPGMVAAHPCAHLDIGVEIDDYGPRAEVVFTYAACRATVEELSDLESCTDGHCSLWERAEEASWAAMRQKAERRLRALELRQDRPETR
ncbi:MAG: hypothetical protein N2512_02315 [Armatimonadetes bacterium]|nr:hypothetical protein [Armatimonadota bacterium]